MELREGCVSNSGTRKLQMQITELEEQLRKNGRMSTTKPQLEVQTYERKENKTWGVEHLHEARKRNWAH